MKIAVGGAISSGKSTLVKQLGELLSMDTMEEFEKDDEIFETLLSWLYEGRPNVEMLLQVYFLHTHWKNQKEYKGDFIVDRDIIEHWLFAQENLKNMPEIMNMYNGVFHAYMLSINKPDLYIILDISWDEFKKRLFKRGRPQEIVNFDKNEKYFKNLLDGYVAKMKAQCIIYDIDYIVVGTDSLDENQVFSIVKHHLREKGVLI